MRFFLPFLLVLALFSSVKAEDGSRSNVPEIDVTALKSNPKLAAKSHTELGSLYFQAGQIIYALEELYLALDADPNYMQAYNVRGLVHAHMREKGLAEKDFSRALSLAPNDPSVNNNYGWFLCETGRPKEALKYFNLAVKNPLYETPQRGYLNAGVCALRTGELVLAESYLLQSVNMSNDGAPIAKLSLAKVYFKKGQSDEARANLLDALRLMEPPTAEALWLAIRLERLAGNRQAENNYVAQLRSRYPASQEYQDFLNGKFGD